VSTGIDADNIGILSGTETENEDARILVASIDTLRRRDVHDVDLIVLDEAHRAQAASYLKLLSACPSVPVLGLTATPWRLDGKQLSDVFAHILTVATTTELIVAGHIAKPVTYGVPLEKARKMVKGLRSSGGDYAQGDLGKSMMRGKLMGDVVREWERLALGVPTICYAASREHGKALQKRFKRRGHRFAYLDGQTPSHERERIVGQLRDGEIVGIVNMDVLSEGFDCPPVKCIILARPTQSLTRYLQQTGRASRKYRGKRPIVLDHAGNTWRFGLPESEQNWDSQPDRQPTGEAPVRACYECHHVMAAGCRVCEECGAELGSSEQERKRLEEEQAALEKLKAAEQQIAAAEARVRDIAKKKGVGDEWVRSVLRAMFEAA
jgi:superfamily II DNA or RNA helicase